MENLNIKNFTLLTGLDEEDYILFATKSGNDGRLKVSVLFQALRDSVVPTIANSSKKWVIGRTDTEVVAEGKTPMFKAGDKTTSAVLWKYEGEAESEWRTLVAWEDVKVNADELTPAQLASLKLSYGDLSDEDKEDLRAVYADIIEACQDATEEANTAAADATLAAERANQAATECENATERSATQTEACQDATEEARAVVAGIQELVNGAVGETHQLITEEVWEGMSDAQKNNGVLYLTYED